ncbi:MAG: hypothetical protein NTZ53_04535 [Cyanobacteria bacterium]|nr:hypothetical protein [Cyanobacteriota bacterium]
MEISRVRPDRLKRPLYQHKRWLAIAIPLGTLVALVAIAPPLPPRPSPNSLQQLASPKGQPFRYLPDPNVFALDFDPRKVQIGLLEGWDREQEAYRDPTALAYVSGPMYERHVNSNGQENTVPLGDIKLGDQVWRGTNRTASRQRAYVGIRHDGHVDFGYGELTPKRAALYDTFIGGLHSIYNDLEAPPAAYKGAYSISMGQQIRYFLPRIRMLIGLRSDGRLEVLMSRDGLTLEQTRALARERGLLAAYLPDHASKSRFIIPGKKGFNDDDANWISGGATSFVHVPYMLRLSERSVPLQGSLLANLSPHLEEAGCPNPWQCGQTLGSQILDRALAGFNRLMEQGVEPIARMIWAPHGASKGPARPAQRSPLREPPITADPFALRQLQQSDQPSAPSDTRLPLAPDLPAPMLLEEGQTLPSEVTTPRTPCQGQDCGTPAPEGLAGPERPTDTKVPGPSAPQELPGGQGLGPASQLQLSQPGPLVPPPPLLPPPPVR